MARHSLLFSRRRTTAFCLQHLPEIVRIVKLKFLSGFPPAHFCRKIFLDRIALLDLLDVPDHCQSASRVSVFCFLKFQR